MGSAVNVADPVFGSENDRLAAGITLAALQLERWPHVGLSGEVIARSSLENVGDSHTVGGTAGLRAEAVGSSFARPIAEMFATGRKQNRRRAAIPRPHPHHQPPPSAASAARPPARLVQRMQTPFPAAGRTSQTLSSRMRLPAALMSSCRAAAPTSLQRRGADRCLLPVGGHDRRARGATERAGSPLFFPMPWSKLCAGLLGLVLGIGDTELDDDADLSRYRISSACRSPSAGRDRGSACPPRLGPWPRPSPRSTSSAIAARSTACRISSRLNDIFNSQTTTTGGSPSLRPTTSQLGDSPFTTVAGRLQKGLHRRRSEVPSRGLCHGLRSAISPNWPAAGDSMSPVSSLTVIAWAATPGKARHGGRSSALIGFDACRISSSTSLLRLLR